MQVIHNIFSGMFFARMVKNIFAEPYRTITINHKKYICHMKKIKENIKALDRS